MVCLLEVVSFHSPIESMYLIESGKVGGTLKAFLQVGDEVQESWSSARLEW